MFDEEAFLDRRVLVTGASRGIGAATARAFAAAGASVAVHYHTGRQEGEAVRAEIGELGPGGGVLVEGDLRDPSAAREVAEAAAEGLGGLDVVVNNAGVTIPRQLGELETGVWDRVLETNLRGAYAVLREALPHLRGSEAAAVVNVSSISAQMGTVDCAYAASKAGLLGLTRALARELGPDGIRVNAVAPGPVDTDLGETVLAFLERTGFHGHEELGTFLDRYAARPEEVAEAILYLAGARFVTGETLTLNGGMYPD